MITIGNKEFRNIQEQVEKNKNDILFILEEEGVLNEFGLTVVGQEASVDDLPATDSEEFAALEYGATYAIGTTEPYRLYIKTRANGTHPNDYWFNLGYFPLPGPQGEAGEDGFSPQVNISNIDGGTRVAITDSEGTDTFDIMDGSNGTNGSDGKSILYYNNNLSTTIGAYNTITLLNAKVGDLVVSLNGILGNVTSISDGVIVQTQTSIIGPRGEQGIQGPEGEQGIQGIPGDDGLSIFYCSSNLATTIDYTVLTPKEDIITQTQTITPKFNDLVIGANGYLGYVIGIGTTSYQIKTLCKLKGENGTNGANGADGITPSITAAATISNTTGTPTVVVTKTGTDINPTFTFAFSNIKGEPGTSTIGVQVVQELPTTGTEGIIYLVPSASASGDDNYDEYIYTNGNWELIGHTAVDLSNYIQKSSTSGLVKNDGTIDTNVYALASALNDYVTATSLSTTLNNYVLASALATVATSGSYNDLTNTPDLSIYAESSDLATVATTGDYDDLLNKPTIPTVNYPVTDVQVDGSSVLDGTVAKITMPTLSAVATSGSYNDLINKPTIPSDMVVIEVSDQTSSGTVSASELSQINTDPTKTLLHRGTVYYNLTGIGTTNIRFTSSNGFTSGATWYTILVNKNNGNWTYEAKTQNYISTYVSDVQVDGSSVVNNGVASITMPTFTQVQANWNELDSTAASYIKNKPTIPTVPITEIKVNNSTVTPVSGVVNITVPNSSSFVTLTGNQVITGKKVISTSTALEFPATQLNNNAQIKGSSTDRLEIIGPYSENITGALLPASIELMPGQLDNYLHNSPDIKVVGSLYQDNQYNGLCDLGGPNNVSNSNKSYWRNLYLSGLLVNNSSTSSSSSTTYGVKIPDSNGWTASKTMATTDDIPVDLTIIEVSGGTGTLSAAELTKVTATPEKVIILRSGVYYTLSLSDSTTYKYCTARNTTSAIQAYTVSINKTTGAWAYSYKTSITSADIDAETKYANGDTFQNGDYYNLTGFITSSSKAIQLMLIPPKSLANVTSITVDKMEFTFRGVGGYVGGSSYVDYKTATGYTVTATKTENNAIVIVITGTNAFSGATNNTPIVAAARANGIQLTFNVA